MILLGVTGHGLRGPSRAERLRTIVEKTGVHSVMATGFHQKPLHPPRLTQQTPRQLEEALIADIVEGAGPNRIKAEVNVASGGAGIPS